MAGSQWRKKCVVRWSFGVISARPCRGVRAVRSQASRPIGVLRTAAETSFTAVGGFGQVAKRRKPDDWLTDNEALAVIRRSVKQHQDSIAQFTAGGRADLVEQETAELTVLKSYLPPALTEVEIEKLTQDKPDIIFIGAYNFADSIMERFKLGVPCVVPLPEFKIYESRN